MPTYTEIRKEHPTMSAASALSWAKSSTDHTRPDYEWKEKRGQWVSRFTREGFDIRVTVSEDPYSNPLDYLGTFVDKWEPGAIMRHEPARGEYRYFVPACSYEDHYKSLRRTMSRHEAHTRAREYVLQDMKRAESYGMEWWTYAVTVTASRAGIELGQTSVCGVEGNKDDWAGVAEDMIPEALHEARAALASLCQDRGET